MGDGRAWDGEILESSRNKGGAFHFKGRQHKAEFSATCNESFRAPAGSRAVSRRKTQIRAMMRGFWRSSLERTDSAGLGCRGPAAGCLGSVSTCQSLVFILLKTPLYPNFACSRLGFVAHKKALTRVRGRQYGMGGV
jgi:hypothetical protein